MLRLNHITNTVLFIAGLQISQAHAQSWVKVESLPSIWMTTMESEENRLWVAGTDKLYFISDHSNAWDSTEVIQLDLHYISDILIHEEVIYITDESKGIFKSEDMGQSWEDYNQGLALTNIRAAVIRDEKIYVATIGEGIYVRNLTSNQGWQPFSSGIFWKNSESISNINGTLVAGVGHNSTLFLNENNENEWEEIPFAEFHGLPSALLSIIEVDDTWIAAGNNGLYKSSDNGRHWTQLNIQTGHNSQARLIHHNEIIYAHLFRNPGISKLVYSTDKGINWNNFTASLNNGLDIIFWKDQMWYAAQNGLWKLETSTRLENEEIFSPQISAFPNPFTNMLNIDIEINIPGHYQIEVHPVDGSKAIYFEDKWLESGRQGIKLESIKSMSPGMYIIKVANSNSVKSVKIFKAD